MAHRSRKKPRYESDRSLRFASNCWMGGAWPPSVDAERPEGPASVELDMENDEQGVLFDVGDTQRSDHVFLGRLVTAAFFSVSESNKYIATNPRALCILSARRGRHPATQARAQYSRIK